MYDLLIKKAGQILTLGKGAKDLGIIENGAIGIEDGKISWIDKSKNIDAKKTIDARGKVVMPGLVDCHTHLVFAGSREFELDEKLKGKSYEEIVKKGGGIHYTVRQTRKASEEELIEQARKRLDLMLLNGTTTAEAKSGYGLDLETEMKILRVIKELNDNHPIDLVPTFLAHAIPPEYEGNEDGYVNYLIDELIPNVAKDARFCDVFCERGFFNIKQSRLILETGKKYGMIPKVHADELTQTRGSELAIEVEAISADHLLMASNEAIKKMAISNMTAVLLPATPFSLMQDKYANARQMIKAGVTVALATDLNPNCWTESMQFIIQLACFKMKMTPMEAIKAATINAARAIKMDREIGSIEVGKKADVIILGCPNHKFLPYHFGINLVKTVIKNGEVVAERQNL